MGNRVVMLCGCPNKYIRGIVLSSKNNKVHVHIQ